MYIRQIYLLLALTINAFYVLLDGVNSKVAFNIASTITYSFDNIEYPEKPKNEASYQVTSIFNQDLYLAIDLISIIRRIPDNDIRIGRDFIPLIKRMTTITDDTAERIIKMDFLWTGILLWTRFIIKIGFEEDNKNYYDELKDIWYANISKLSSDNPIKNLNFPGKETSSQAWENFEEELCKSLKICFDIGYSWLSISQHLDLLAEYMESCSCMLECLNLATVADRDAIRNRLLLPPQP